MSLYKPPGRKCGKKVAAFSPEFMVIAMTQNENNGIKQKQSYKNFWNFALKQNCSDTKQKQWHKTEANEWRKWLECKQVIPFG